MILLPPTDKYGDCLGGNIMEKTFEEAVIELEKLVQTLEDGECSLEESMKLFEEGMKLTKYCNDKLQNAEKRIVELVNENGKITEVELD
jgi:exodeoxyribonuclease VII small subunit